MSRVCAIVLLLAIGFWPAAPVLATESAPELPACCRAHGKHQCMMRRMAGMDDAMPPQAAIAPKCPFIPAFGWNAVTGSSALFSNAAQSVFGLVATRPVVQTQAEALFRISFARSRQKRGPPAVLL